jgi:hypothetical protein
MKEKYRRKTEQQWLIDLTDYYNENYPDLIDEVDSLIGDFDDYDNNKKIPLKEIKKEQMYLFDTFPEYSNYLKKVYKKQNASANRLKKI